MQSKIDPGCRLTAIKKVKYSHLLRIGVAPFSLSGKFRRKWIYWRDHGRHNVWACQNNSLVSFPGKIIWKQTNIASKLKEEGVAVGINLLNYEGERIQTPKLSLCCYYSIYCAFCCILSSAKDLGQMLMLDDVGSVIAVTLWFTRQSARCSDWNWHWSYQVPRFWDRCWCWMILEVSLQ